MSNRSIGFLGGERVTRILLEGWTRANALPANILVSDSNAESVAKEKLEAYAILTAMGPTYLWFQLQALREVAAGFGLNDAEITPALAGMEAQVSELYRTRLPALYQKIKP